MPTVTTSIAQRIAYPEPVGDLFVQQFPEYPRVFLQIMHNRGLETQEAIDAFLNPEYSQLHDPYLFQDMHTAVDRIYQAIEKKELIAIHGDYDADGVSGAAILQQGLQALGAATTIFLPHREKDGYGMNVKTVDYLHGLGVKLIITCDCGISNTVEIAAAKEKGIDTIITDHHQVPAVLPPAIAIIHPKRSGETYPFNYLAGGGVAFKLVQGLIRDARSGMTEQQIESFEKWLLDLVAIATVGDMVELIGENRVLVKYGLLVLAKNRRKGLQQMFALASIDPAKITTETIGFQIAPRINAAGRMDHANAAYLLMVAATDGEAEQLTKTLEGNNRDRQKVTEQVFREARSQAVGNTDPFLFLYHPTWPIGLFGLVAGKVSKEFGKPVFLGGNDGTKVVASGRSPAGVDIMAAVNECKDLLISFGGHTQACGIRFLEENFDTVRARLLEHFKSTGTTVQLEIRADAPLSFKDITWELVALVERLAPFGQANREPLFVSRGVTIVSSRAVGKNGQHYKLVLAHDGRTLPAIAFSMPAVPSLAAAPVDLVYSIAINEWNGNRELQLTVEHIQSAHG